MKHVGSVAGALASTAINIALTSISSSVGGIIVYVIDNYIDPRLGFKMGNGRSFALFIGGQNYGIKNDTKDSLLE